MSHLVGIESYYLLFSICLAEGRTLQGCLVFSVKQDIFTQTDNPEHLRPSNDFRLEIL